MVLTSFYEWDGLPESPRIFMGIENYIKVFSDYAAQYAVKNIVIVMVTGVVFTIPIAFFLATVINKVFLGKRIFRVFYFMPVLINRVAIGLMFTFIFFPEVGPASVILEQLQIMENVNLLGNVSTAMYTVVFVNVWCNVGFEMIILSSGMASLSDDIYEAAELDGVTAWQKLRYITIPMMKGTLKIAVILELTGAFKVFDMVMALTEGGPGNMTQLPSTLLYKVAFSQSQFGYANAIGVMTVIFCLAVTAVVNFIFKDREKSEKGV